MKLTYKLKQFLFYVLAIVLFIPHIGYSEEPAQEMNVAEMQSPKAAEPSPSYETSVPDEENTNKEFHPKVIITMLGSEMNLNVIYDHPMDFSGQNYIEYIRMESLEGEFLGLSTFNEKSNAAEVAFTINPKLTPIDTVRLVAKSSQAGLIKSLHKLKVNEPDVKPAAALEPSKKETSSPKKKFWGIF